MVALRDLRQLQNYFGSADFSGSHFLSRADLNMCLLFRPVTWSFHFLIMGQTIIASMNFTIDKFYTLFYSCVIIKLRSLPLFFRFCSQLFSLVIFRPCLAPSFSKQSQLHFLRGKKKSRISGQLWRLFTFLAFEF